MAEENAPRPPAPPAAPSAPSGQLRAAHQDIRRTFRAIRDASARADLRPGREVRGGRADGPGGPAKRGKRNFVRKKKVCRFCVDKVGLHRLQASRKFWRRSCRSAERFFRAA